MVNHPEKSIQHLRQQQWACREQGLVSENVHQKRKNENNFHEAGGHLLKLEWGDNQANYHSSL
jgi:hypothetical protein